MRPARKRTPGGPGRVHPGAAAALAGIAACAGVAGALFVRRPARKPIAHAPRTAAAKSHRVASKASTSHRSRAHGGHAAAAVLQPGTHPAQARPPDPETPEQEAAPALDLPLTPVNPELVSFQPTSRLLMRGPSSPARVALTFDAGSDARAVPLILQALEERHAHATFFLTGRFCEKFPAECRAIADAGMELGNHSYDHPHFTRMSEAKIRQELDRAEAAIVKACGRGAKPLFRFPFGDNNARTQRIVAECGYQPVHWTLDSLDAFGQPKSVSFVADRICGRVAPGYITLMHVSCVTSAEALPRIFARLDEIGAQVVPVSELLLSAPEERKADIAARGARIAQ